MITLRPLAIALVIAGAPSLASAQTTTTTTTTVERSGPARLSQQQRTTIYRTVTQERRTVPAEVDVTRRVVPPDVDYTVGRPVPPSVVLETLPESVYVETPTLPRYKYFYVNNRMMLVDPTTSEVVDILDQ